MTIQPLTPELAKGFRVSGGTGALVASVQESSPAAQAGIKAGDIITEFDGHKIAQSADLPKLVAATPVGRQVPVTVVREGRTVALSIKVAQMDEPGQAAVAQTDEEKGPLGLTVETVTPSLAKELGLADARGVVVRSVRSSSPAENAGIRPGDVITEVDHRAVADAVQMKRALDKHPKGAPMVMMLHRDGNSLLRGDGLVGRRLSVGQPGTGMAPLVPGCRVCASRPHPVGRGAYTGRHLHKLITEYAASRLRMPKGRYRPEPRFQWLDNPRVSPEDSQP